VEAKCERYSVGLDQEGCTKVDDRQTLQNQKSGASAHEHAGRGEMRSKATGWVERQRTRKARLIGLLIAETEVSDQACDFLHVGQALVLQTNARERSVSTVSKAGYARQSVAGGSAGARTERQGEYCQPRPAQPPCFAHRMLNPIALPQRLRKDAGKWSLRSPAACASLSALGLLSTTSALSPSQGELTSNAAIFHGARSQYIAHRPCSTTGERACAQTRPDLFFRT
jgi:hypothetical protein